MMEWFTFFVLAAVAIGSIVVNVSLVWYIRRVMSRSSLMSDITSDVLVSLSNFSTHLEQVYELPLFYGDETLRGLLEHSREIVDEVKSYKDGFIFGEEEGRLDEETAEGSEEE